MNLSRSRVSLLNTWIDKVDLEEAGTLITDFVRTGIPRQIVTVNLDFLRLSTRDRSFQELINTADLVVPDGMPLVWASRLLNNALPHRVPGVDLVVECARVAAQYNYSIFLLGAGPGVADDAAKSLRQRFPQLRIAGIYSPSTINEAEDAVTLERIRQASPDMLFVAFGAPRQDYWIRKYMHILNVPVCMGVGGTFDMLSGRVSRAPQWMQSGGVEWFHRFYLEPGRLWKRYFIQDLPVFLHLMIRCSTGISPSTPIRNWDSTQLLGGEPRVTSLASLTAPENVSSRLG
jgi:N-acetylglucosaminyldiphosphoundecaprenol N-acetyl-beta-D-mannosaminyltransferase